MRTKVLLIFLACVCLVPSAAVASRGPLWEVIYDTGGSDTAAAMTRCADGFVVLTSESRILRYSADGTLQWTAAYDGASFSGIAADASGNVYVAGTAGYGSFLAKYDAGGVLQWSQTGPGIYWDATGASKVVAAPDGTIYVLGYDRHYFYYLDGYPAWYFIGASFGYHVTKYDGDGAVLSRFSAGGYYQGRTSSGTLWRSMTLSPSGNEIYLSGGLDQGSYWSLNMVGVIGKYLTDGTNVWTKSVDESAGWDTFTSAAIDDAGNSYVTASYASKTQRNSDAAVLKFGPDGTLLWQQSTDNENDSLAEVALDPAGIAHAAGTISYDDGVSVLFLQEFAPDGTPVDSSLSDDRDYSYSGASIIAGPDCLYILGTRTGVNGNDVFVRKYAVRP